MVHSCRTHLSAAAAAVLITIDLADEARQRMRACRLLGLMLGLALGSLPVASAGGELVVTVTVKDLIASGHRIEIGVGTRVVWADPHFERVWFASGSGAPSVERTAGAFEARFDKAGVYRGVFTMAGTRGTRDVESLTVVVREPR